MSLFWPLTTLRIKLTVHIEDSRPFLVRSHPVCSLESFGKPFLPFLLAPLLLFHPGASCLEHFSQWFFTLLMPNSSLSSQFKHCFFREGFTDDLRPFPTTPVPFLPGTLIFLCFSDHRIYLTILLTVSPHPNCCAYSPWCPSTYPSVWF